jgi:type IV pilus assembly protein PilM
VLQSSNLVGLDIGTHSVKLVELLKAKGVWQLVSFAVSPVPHGAIVEGEIVDPEALIEVIQDLFRSAKIKSRRVCVSISGSSVIIKRVPIPALSEKEVNEQVTWEAEQYIPFDLDEVYMDHQIVSKDVAASNCEVVLTAAKKEFVDSYVTLIKNANLKPILIDLDTFAVSNVFEANYEIDPKESVVLVDLGAASMKLSIHHGGGPLFTRDIPMGGNYLTSEIQKKLQVSWQDAEMLKVGGQGGGMPQEVADVIRLAVENLVNEVRRSIDFFIASSSDHVISYGLVTGGGTRVPGLVDGLQESIGVPFQILNPFGGINPDPKIFPPDYISEISPIASVATGLAMRGVLE